MDEKAIFQWIHEAYPGVETSEAYGYTFFFYGPDRKMPFATIGSSDNEYDRASHLDRESVFRLNIGVKRETYQALFGPQPPAAGESGVVETGHDFSVLDQLLPHPIYAPQSWVCILSPSQLTFREKVTPLLTEAHELAQARHFRRESKPADA